MLLHALFAFLLISFTVGCQPLQPTFSLEKIGFFYDLATDSYVLGLFRSQSHDLFIFHHDGTFGPVTDCPHAIELQLNFPLKPLGLAAFLKFLEPHYYHLDWSSFESTAKTMSLDSLKLLPADFWNAISSQNCVDLIIGLGEKQRQLDFMKFLESIGVRTIRFSLSSSIHGICHGASEGDTLDPDDRTFVLRNGGGSNIITHHAWKRMKLHVKYFEEYDRVETGTPLYLYSDA